MKKLFVILITIIIFISAGAQPYTGLQSMDPAQYNALPANLPATTADKLPVSIDLSPNLPPVGNQSPQNSCVAWAVAYAAQSYNAKAGLSSWGSYTYSTGQINPSRVFSPSYVYNQINNNADKGSSFYTALQLLKTQGVCTMSSMPYTHFLNQPSAAARSEAGNYKIKSFRRLGEVMDPILDAKDQLAQGHPVIINAVTDLTYFDNGFKQSRPSPYVWRTVGNVKQGLNHALLVVGYDDNMQAFKFVNSWDVVWGDKGFGWISYNNYNKVVVESFIMIPAFGEAITPNQTVYRENTVIDQTDRNNGFNFFLTNVSHMNSVSNPGVPIDNMYMRIQGMLSIPANSGTSAGSNLFLPAKS